MVKLKVVKVGNEYGVGKVGTTNSYFPSYGTGTKAEMEIVVMKSNIHYYYWKARDEYEKLGKIDPEYDEYTGTITFGDCVC